MANTVTIDSHPETTFGGADARIGCSYRMKRGYVSEDTEARTFRYEPTNIIPASAEVVIR